MSDYSEPSQPFFYEDVQPNTSDEEFVEIDCETTDEEFVENYQSELFEEGVAILTAWRNRDD
jgi:hypothetical protein